MNKEEICKVKTKGGIYKVNAMVDSEGRTHYYRVMHGRKITKYGAFFKDKRSAIEYMLRIALNDINE